MAMKTMLDALKTFAELQQLVAIFSDGQPGQEARWNALQQWLDKHPSYKARLNHCLKLSSADAVQYLCTELGLDPDLIKPFDPDGNALKMAEQTVAQIQTLYNNRKGESDEVRLEATATCPQPAPIRRRRRRPVPARRD